MAVAAPARARALTASEAAWIASVPVALVTALAILVLGPPLGRGLFGVERVPFFEWWRDLMRPEPVEHGRFLVALGGPLLLAGATAVLMRRPAVMRSELIGLLVTGAQLVLLTFVAACLMAQWEIGFGRLDPPAVERHLHRDYFTFATVLVAAVTAVAVALAATSAAARARFAAWTRDTRARRLVAGAVALVAIAVWLLHAFNTEGTFALTYAEVDFHAVFTLDETFAVLEGRTPLVDFATQYAALWPFAFALGLSLFGVSVATWVGLALALTASAMLALYAVLRRVADSALAGLLLFLPVLATSFFAITEPTDNRYTYANYYGAFPLRYAAPLILAWLLARHLDGARPRRPWPLFLLAGLIVLNGPETGIPAVGATLAALLWGGGRPNAAGLRRLAIEAVGGLVLAFALVSALTLVRAGSLPDPEVLLAYSRVFAEAGFGMIPMPAIGLHTVIYLTFVAAIGVATVRALGGARGRVLTGMLAWSGVFGLGASAYYVGRSMPSFLTATFSWWSLALALLFVTAIRSLATWRGSGRALPIAQVACIFAFGVAACSLVQTPTPWGQIERLRESVPTTGEPNGQAFVARHTGPGEPVAILIQFGHRVAYNLGIENVAPYTGTLSMPLQDQLDTTIAALREAGGSKVILTPDHTGGDFQLELAANGFRLADQDPRTVMELWVDRRGGVESATP